jgi:glycerol uptake facilitator-like aquaporin
MTSTTLKNYWKAGFGTGGGVISAFMAAMFVALLFFIPGFILITRENKKSKESRDTTMLVVGFVLMFIGVILSAGAFGGTALNSLANQF